MQFKLHYGDTYQNLFIDEKKYSVEVIEPAHTSAIKYNPYITARDAILHPLGSFSWQDFSPQKVRSIAIAINDNTRPVPHDLILPPLLDHLHQLGFSADAIKFYIATGTHVPIPEKEFTKILPLNIINHYRILSHNCDNESNLQFLGKTSRNTNILVNKAYYNSDFKIVTGNIEPHHFMGFSGCNKSASIGLTGRTTITENHAFISSPFAKVGIYEENPMRQDVEEIGKMIGVHAALNVIMNTEREIVHFLFGEPLETMATGVNLCKKVYQTPVNKKFDLVIASVGGYPKDINFYQAQKAFTHAALITKQGGTVVLCAECREGSGSTSYEDFVSQFSTYKEALIEFEKRPFEIGPHKAYQVAKLLEEVNLQLVSCISPTLANRMLLNADENIQEVVDNILKSLSSDACIAILPKAINTIPIH